MNFTTLRTLIETHPDHATTTDAALAAWANEVIVDRAVTTLDASEVLDVILSNTSEWLAMTADERQMVSLILSTYDQVPVATGTNPRTVLQAVLGTATKTELGTRLTKTVSRAADAGLSQVAEGHVAYARNF